jgi:hypothetical protein
MLKQVEFSWNTIAATPYGENWNPINVSGYDTIAMSIEAPTGFIGTISFMTSPTNMDSMKRLVIFRLPIKAGAVPEVIM